MKRYAQAVLDAIAESLRTAYWYQDDLPSFLTRAGVPPARLSVLPWGTGSYMRAIARQLIDNLAAEPASGMPVLETIVDSLVELDEHFHQVLKDVVGMDGQLARIVGEQAFGRHSKSGACICA